MRGKIRKEFLQIELLNALLTNHFDERHKKSVIVSSQRRLIPLILSNRSRNKKSITHRTENIKGVIFRLKWQRVENR